MKCCTYVVPKKKWLFKSVNCYNSKTRYQSVKVPFKGYRC